MQSWIIFFFLGVSTLLVWRDLASLYLLSILLPLFIFWRYVKKPQIKKYFLWLLAFAAGFSWALVYTYVVFAWSLPKELEGKKLVVGGYVASLPAHKMNGTAFEFQTESINKNLVNAKIKLSWHGEHPQIKSGDKWLLLVRLKRPHGVLNPGGFDMEKHLAMRHVRATGYVVAGGVNQILEQNSYRYPLTRLRQILIAKMSDVLAKTELAPVIVAFVSAFEEGITKDQWRVMRDTGTSYLVAISGLHIGLVAGVVFVFIRFLWRFSSRLVLLMPAHDAGLIAGLIFGFIYGAVSGFSVPTQRALVMLSMFSLVALSRRYTQTWDAFLWSLFLVVVINPLAILGIGFWLSFIAVAAIIYVSSNRVRQSKTHLKKFWRMQFTVSVALLPLTLLFFKQFSFISIIANLIAMPLVCMVIVPLSLFGAILLPMSEVLGAWILWCADLLLKIVWWWLSFLTDFFGYNWHHPIYNLWILLASCVAGVLILAPRGFPGKSIAVLWMLPLFFYSPQVPDLNSFWVTVLEVGQGLAVVVQTKNHVLIYDTGPSFMTQDAGERVVNPYLVTRSIKFIDTMIVSHGDSDHSGGAKSILKEFKTKRIFTSSPEKLRPYRACDCSNEKTWHWDGVRFQLLALSSDLMLSGNNASCVLRVSNAKYSVLLPGDIESLAEGYLVNKYGDALKSSVLIAPHHGSSTSSTQELLEAVKPKHVVFSTGYRNHFHFPHNKVTASYAAMGAILYNTPDTGAITFKFSDKSDIIATKLYRREVKHFWHNIKY